MTNPDYTALVLVADRSGSMMPIANDMVGGLTGLLEEQANPPGSCTVDVVLFDHEYEELTHLADPKDVTIDLKPRGMTALHDAIGRKITSFGAALEKMPEDKRPSKVLFVIATDGAENSSSEYTSKAVRDLITTQKEQFNWELVFLGANQDAIVTAKAFNIDAGSALTFGANSAGVRGSVDVLSAYAATYRSAGAASFSDKDRVAANS